MTDYSTLIEQFFRSNIEHTFVIDLETTNYGPAENEINPAVPRNEVVLGWMQQEITRRSGETHRHLHPITPGYVKVTMDLMNKVSKVEPILIIGHNIKFDLRYMMRNGFELNNNVYIWDTAVYFYLHSGMQRIFPSLEDTAAHHGVPYVKNPDITKAFKEGKCAKDLDQAALSAYCNDDVTATEAIYKQQSGSWASATSILPRNFRVQMQFLKALVKMEHNGIKMDMTAVMKKIIELSARQTTLNAEVIDFARIILNDKAALIENPTSNRTLSTILYGMPGIKVHEQVPSGLFTKGGKPKHTRVETTLTNSDPDITTRKKPSTSLYNTTLGYPVDEKTLTKMRNNVARPLPLKYRMYIDSILELRKIDKIVNTYLKPMYLWHATTYLETIHPYYQNTATHTGRLSSAKPNGQNIPPVVVDMMEPHYPGYETLLVDFKQLEVCGLGELSRDPQLLLDLANGVDIHKEVGKSVFGSEMSKEQRRIVKGVVFGTIYGGGSNTLAEQTGVNREIVKKIQAEFFRRYSTLKNYYTSVEAECKEMRYPTGETSPTGAQVFVYELNSPTGRIYTIKEVDGEPGYTQTRNHRVQGWATGDIVPLFIGLFNFVIDAGTFTNAVFLTSTVHDSLRLDCIPDTRREVENVLEEIASSMLPQAYEYWTGQPLTVNLKVDFELVTKKESA